MNSNYSVAYNLVYKLRRKPENFSHSLYTELLYSVLNIPVISIGTYARRKKNDNKSYHHLARLEDAS